MISFLNRGSGGGSSKANIFIQNTEPETKEGIWFKKASSSYDKLITADTISGDMSTSTNTVFSTSVDGMSVQSYGKYLYLLDTNNSIYTGIRYDTETNTEIYDYTEGPVSNAQCSAIIGDKIYYFIYSQTASFDNIINCYEYDITNNTWETYSTSSSSLDISCEGTMAVAVGTKIYLISGNTSGNSKQINIFDTSSKAWTKQDNKLPFSCYHGTATAVGTQIYIFGAADTANQTSRQVYDTETNTVSTYNDIPFNSYKDSAVSKGTQIYIIHGNSLYLFNTITETYENLGTIPVTFEALDAKNKSVIIDNVIYLISPGNNLTKIIPSANINFEANSVVLHNGSTYKTALLTQPANAQGRVTTSFANAYMTDSSGNLITTDEKYYGNGTSWVEIV